MIQFRAALLAVFAAAAVPAAAQTTAPPAAPATAAAPAAGDAAQLLSAIDHVGIPMIGDAETRSTEGLVLIQAKRADGRPLSGRADQATVLFSITPN